MKKPDRFIAGIFSFLLALMPAILLAQTSNENPKEQDPEKSKKEWIRQNPDQYKKMNGNQPFTESQKANENQTQKSEEKRVIEVRREERTIIEGDPSYPKYVNTRNPEKDQAEYQEKKQKWIEANPDKYKSLTATEKSTPLSREERLKQQRK